MKIGITANLNNKRIFSNGLGQNTVFLYDALEKIEGVDSISLVDIYNLKDEEYQNISWLDGYDVIKWSSKELKNIDLLIVFGSFPPESEMKKFKGLGNKKIVYYCGGNNLVLDMERMIFDKPWKRKNQDMGPSNFASSKQIDEVWMVPQQEYHNLEYLSIVFNCPAKVVPFIWSPKFINQHANQIKNAGSTAFFDERIKDVDQWRIGSIEPNINIVKTAYPILFILEHFWNNTKNKNLVQGFNIMNAKELMDNPTLLGICSRLNIHKDKKTVFDDRYPIAFVSSKILDLVVSHQWENPLNYAYLDLVYLGIPLIHNARLCKDIGYYYEDYKLKEASNLIELAISSRKKDIEYTSRNRNIVKRYMIEHNNEMLNQYSELVHSIFRTDKFSKNRYNWETNLLE